MLLLGLAFIEGSSYWWMHPAPAGLGQPVLVYRPQARGQLAAGSEQAAAPQLPGENPSLIQNPEFKIQNPTSSTTTLLPEIVAKATPILRCSNGTAARIEESDGTTVHLAFFEWDLTDSTNVLEAFKHLPDECMGSIGMTLTSQQPPRSYQVGGETLWFDHTVFRDQGGTAVHAFKGTWVSGAASLTGSNYRGGVDQWRQIRWKSAYHRFHPAYARVAQGAVRGIPNPDLAWETFANAMLKDLRME